MKRYLFLLTFILLSTSVFLSAFAKTEEISLEGIDQKQLIQLRDEIYNRLNASEAPWHDEKWNSDEPVRLEPGDYWVGKDIPVDTWILSSTDEKDGSIVVYTMEKQGETRGNTIYTTRLFKERGDIVLTLTADTYLRLYDPVLFKR